MHFPIPCTSNDSRALANGLEQAYPGATVVRMHGEDHPAKRQLRLGRERTLEGLSIAFTRDELSLEQFENRVDRAFLSATVDELEALLADLSPSVVSAQGAQAMVSLATPASTAGVVAPPTHALRVAHTAPPRVAAVFGNVERQGPMLLPPRSRVLAAFGNVDLDLRHAEPSERITEIEAQAVFGNIELLVPPQWSVICEGTCVFGSFASVHRVDYEDNESGPVLRITGRAVFGNVEVRTLPKGVSREYRPKQLVGRRG